MLSHTRLLLSCLSTLFLCLASPLAHSDDDPLAAYQNLIKQSLKAPADNTTVQTSQLRNNPAVSSGQAALVPAPTTAPSAPPPAVSQSAPTYSTASPATAPGNYVPNNSNQPAATAPAGPPNIFISPGPGAPATNQSSTIHY